MLLSLGAFVLATKAMISSAAAGCVPLRGYDVCRPPAPVPYVPSAHNRNNTRKRRTFPRPYNTSPSAQNRSNARKRRRPQALRQRYPRTERCQLATEALRCRATRTTPSSQDVWRMGKTCARCRRSRVVRLAEPLTRRYRFNICSVGRLSVGSTDAREDAGSTERWAPLQVLEGLPRPGGPSSFSQSAF
jgi:hypothetical protein